MGEDMYVPVFHHGGRFEEVDGVLCYLDGSVKRWQAMDIDLVCFFDLKDFLNELGYKKYKKLLWHDTRDPDLNTSLHHIKGDAEINELRGVVVRNMGPKEFHIYVEHVVDTPVVVEDSNDDSESELEKVKKKKVLRVKSPKKKCPTKKRDYGLPKSGKAQLSPKTAKRKQSKKYTGARRKHVLRNGNCAVDDGPDQNSGPEPELGLSSKASNPRADHDRAATSEGGYGPSVDLDAYEQDSDYERPYEYESEAFNSPVSSEDEGGTAYDAFNEDTEYGEVEFKVE
ncbi:hypothetical protein PIB30_014135 [Stylosanthes scabra]|uniref:PB1-like domain-containing protein n=1 Tax=Stylosanthes scabra TaxID=79078 RepID=A0ABU6T7G3_9FABA|nr:hypothetical protein [Stylosanthes scabra]